MLIRKTDEMINNIDKVFISRWFYKFKNSF